MTLEKVISGLSNDTIDFKPQYNHSFLRKLAIYNESYIVKELDNNKIKRLYSGQYVELANYYYSILKEILPVVDEYKCFEYEGRILEVMSRIDKLKFLELGNEFTWNEFLLVLETALEYVDNIKEYNDNSNIRVGIDSALWNFTIDGKAFDFSPPRILDGNNNSIFARNSLDHYRRTYYRFFDYEGMRANLLATAFKILGNKEINIFDLPANWEAELFLLFSKYACEETVDFITSEKEYCADFEKHPIKIIRGYLNGKHIK